MSELRYPVCFIFTDAGYTVKFIDFPKINIPPQRTREEAIITAEYYLSCHIWSLFINGGAIPELSRIDNEYIKIDIEFK